MTQQQVIVAVQPGSTVTNDPSALLFATANQVLRNNAVSLRKQHFEGFGSAWFLQFQDNPDLDFTPKGNTLAEKRWFFKQTLAAGNAALLGETAEKSQIDFVILVDTMLADILFEELKMASVNVAWATVEDKRKSDAMLPILASLQQQPPIKTTARVRNHAYLLPAKWQGLSPAELCPLLAGQDGKFGARVIGGKPATGNQRIVISGTEEQMGCARDSNEMKWFEINAQFVNDANETIREVYSYVAAADAGHAQGIVTTWVKENDPNVAFSVQADQLNKLYLFDWHVSCKDITNSADQKTKKYLVDRRALELNSFYHTKALRNERSGGNAVVADSRVTALEQQIAALSQQVTTLVQPQQTADVTVLQQRVTVLETANTMLQKQVEQQNAAIEALLQRVTALEKLQLPKVETPAISEAEPDEESRPDNNIAELEAQKQVVVDIKTAPDVDKLVQKVTDEASGNHEAALVMLDQRTSDISTAEAEAAKAAIAKELVERSKEEMPEEKVESLTPQQRAFEEALKSGGMHQPNPAEEREKNRTATAANVSTLVNKYCQIEPRSVSPCLTGVQRDNAVAAATAEYNHKQELATRRFAELFGNDTAAADQQLSELLQGFNPHRFEDVDATPDEKIIAFKGKLKGRLGYYTLSYGSDGKLVATFFCQ